MTPTTHFGPPTGEPRPSDFLRAMHFLHVWEGGYTPGEGDPGGRTKYGISQRAYPDLDIDELTWDEAQAIYRRDYWDELDLDSLPWPLNIVVMNAAVNAGVRVARDLLEDTQDPEEYLARFLVRYTQLGNGDLWPRFGRGWTRRTADLLSLVAGHDSTYDVDTLVLHLPGVRQPVVYRGAAMARTRGTRVDVRFLGENEYLEGDDPE